MVDYVEALIRRRKPGLLVTPERYKELFNPAKEYPEVDILYSYCIYLYTLVTLFSVNGGRESWKTLGS